LLTKGAWTHHDNATSLYRRHRLPLRVHDRRRSLAAVPLKTICRVKGQEDNNLHGLGLVVGLKVLETAVAFSHHPQHGRGLGNVGKSLARDAQTELKDAKNVALVLVTATVPPAGARQGDRIDCQVHSVDRAKVWQGTTIPDTACRADPRDRRVYALAEVPLPLKALTHQPWEELPVAAGWRQISSIRLSKMAA